MTKWLELGKLIGVKKGSLYQIPMDLDGRSGILLLREAEGNRYEEE